MLALDTIVAGQRIKDVLAQMRSTCAHLKRPCWTTGGGVKVGMTAMKIEFPWNRMELISFLIISLHDMTRSHRHYYT